MRLVATEYVTFDGVSEEPGRWSGPFFNEEAQKFKFDELQATDALLLGRKTYEGFAAAWPKMQGTGEFGVKMNNMPKYVVSSTLKTVDWTGARLITDDVAGEVRKLKAAPGNDLLLSGSGQLFNSLMQSDLIDLYRFMLHPVVLGTGRRLFPEQVAKRAFELTETKRFSSGIVILEYQAKSA